MEERSAFKRNDSATSTRVARVAKSSRMLVISFHTELVLVVVIEGDNSEEEMFFSCS